MAFSEVKNISQIAVFPLDTPTHNGYTLIMMMIETDRLRARAAAALDATHDPQLAYRGPRTYQTRQRLAARLDDGQQLRMADIKWLEYVATTRRGTESR